MHFHNGFQGAQRKASHEDPPRHRPCPAPGVSHGDRLGRQNEGYRTPEDFIGKGDGLDQRLAGVVDEGFDGIDHP